MPASIGARPRKQYGPPSNGSQLVHFESTVNLLRPLFGKTSTNMATFGAIRRLVVFTAVTSGPLACVSRLDNLHGYVDSGTSEAPSVVATSTGDAAIVAITSEPNWDSGAGESASPGPTTTSGPTTTPIPTTPPCTDGLLNDEGFCVPQVRCAPGTFVAEADGERVCSPCASGHFSSEYDAEECQPWRDCEVGDYVKEAGTSTTDRVCETCPDGETTTTVNSGACAGESDCEAGTFERGDECVACSAGNYCSGKTDAEVPCDGNTWDDDGDPATLCVVKTSCAAGQFVIEDGTSVVDRSCDFCDEETFSSESNAATCTNWSTCEAGRYVSLQGTSTTDRECADCLSGTFASAPNLAACESWKTCSAPSEYAASAPSAEQDRTCSACSAGYQASEDNAEACDVPIPPNLVTNYDFESDANGWESWVGTVSVSTARAHTGTRSLLVSGASTGPAATSLDSVIEAGATYDVSFWVNVDKADTVQVNITRSLTCNGSTTYLWLANDAAVVRDTWTQLVGNFAIPSSCGSPKAKVYAEGSGANIDLYVDNVSVTKAP